MRFDELRKELEGVNFTKLRKDLENNFEAVVIQEEIANLNARLEKFLGAPLWPSNRELPAKVKDIIEAYGGVLTGQTLYFYDQGENAIFAMLWPWQDGKHTTVKIINK